MQHITMFPWYTTVTHSNIPAFISIWNIWSCRDLAVHERRQKYIRTYVLSEQTQTIDNKNAAINTAQVAVNDTHGHMSIFAPFFHIIISYKCTFVHMEHDTNTSLSSYRINDIVRSYQWCDHPSMWVTLHGVRGKRKEVLEKTD